MSCQEDSDEEECQNSIGKMAFQEDIVMGNTVKITLERCLIKKIVMGNSVKVALETQNSYLYTYICFTSSKCQSR